MISVPPVVFDFNVTARFSTVRLQLSMGWCNDTGAGLLTPKLVDLIPSWDTAVVPLRYVAYMLQYNI